MEPNLYVAAANIGRSTDNWSESVISDFLDSNGVAQITCGHGNTVLHVAAMHGNKQAVAHILRLCPSLALERNGKGDTPLHVAARSEHTGVATLLVEHFCSEASSTVEAGEDSALRAVNCARETALHEAVKNGRFCMAKMLVEKDPGLASVLNSAGESVLFVAADRGFYDIALGILETFPHCSVFGRNDMTAVHAAVIRKDNPLVRKLLETCGPEILEIADNIGWMPLHYAANSGNVEVVKVILKANSALAYIKDSHGMSPLHIAAGNGWSRVVKAFVYARPDVCELTDARGRTALHVAVHRRREKVIKTLLDMVAFDNLVNERDSDGNTAMHVAAGNVHFNTLRMLALDDRVDKEILNNEEMTAFDIFSNSITELTPIEKGFMMLVGKHCNIQSLRSTVAEESRLTRSATQRGHEISTENTVNVIEKGTAAREYVKNMADINLVIATLIVGITFAAGVQMPGGYNDEGIANLKDNPAFKYFLLYDALAFGCAAGSLLTYFTSTIFSRMFQFLRPRASGSLDIIVVMLFTALSVTFAMAAFMYATNAVLYRETSTIFQISVYYLFWKLGLPATVAYVGVSIPALYFIYHLAPVLRLYFFGPLEANISITTSKRETRPRTLSDIIRSAI